jgi:integrase
MPRARLTQLAVDRLRPAASGRLDLFDTVLPGFGIRVFESGVRSWFCFYRLNGKQRRHTIGTLARIPRLEDARQRARDILAMVDRGEDPDAGKARSGLTVEAAAMLFVARYASVRNRDWRTTERLLRNHVLPAWGSRPARDIVRRDVIRLMDGLADKGMGAGANRVLAAIRKLFAWLAEREEIDASPVAGISPPARESSRDRVLTVPELAAVWRASDGLGYPGGAFVRTLILLGQRRTVTARMRWADIDMGETLWRIPAADMKAGRPHDVPLPRPALDLLESLPRLGEKWVFTSSGAAPISGYSDFKERLDSALPDLAPWRLHDIRRSVATHMAALGMQRVVIERLLAHADRSVTGRYERHSHLPEVRGALEIWTKTLVSPVT